MNLWHVSDQGDIAVFKPRTVNAAESMPVVWAVADSHLENYLLPRDCPRVCLRFSERTENADRERFFGETTARTVILIENAWWERLCRSAIWLYEMPSESFTCCDANAGYFTSLSLVTPRSVERIDSPLGRLLSRDVEVHMVPRLRPVADAVAASTLQFSIIRLRNALP